jgi:selenide,water dikinase
LSSQVASNSASGRTTIATRLVSCFADSMDSVVTPIQKSVVLVGAGNAHLVFLKRWGMRPAPGVAVTLVNPAAVIPYSAMVPAHIGGDYAWDEITIDLVRLCQAVKVRFVAEAVTRIDPGARQVHFAGRPPLSYDALSLGLGSIPACPAPASDNGSSLVLRPLGKLLRELDDLEVRVRQSSGFHLAVVGGGASGCELALAIHKRLGGHAGFRMSLLQGNERLLPEFPAKVARLFEQALTARGIAIQLNARVTSCQSCVLTLEDGRRAECDAVLWATNAAPPPLERESGLAVDPGGFLIVRETLQTVSDPAIFGTGDCVDFPAYPDLPKNGVHAVREGKVLFDNVIALLHDRPLRPFRPQRFCLTLLNTADGKAVFVYGGLAFKCRWARRLKDRIDRRWINKLTRFKPMESPAEDGEESALMRCGGCGSKISGDVLSAVLKRIEVGNDSRVLMGCRAGEDAAVFRARPELYGADAGRLVEVQTVDYFRAFVDDPFLFGRLAAHHAVSDLYAMNARPFSALAVATLPYARGPIQEAQLFELLSGAMKTFGELGVVLVGGHTTEGSELALGFAVTGHGEEDRLFQKGRLRVGDRLVLTKPLGSGAILAAWMRAACKAPWFDKLVRSMLVSNRAAAEIFARTGVTACTDITGFGLAGHLLEMLDASRLSAKLDPAVVPLHEGFTEVVAEGIVSSLQRDNAKLSCRVQAEGPPPAWLFDPQTAGGLLAGVAAENVESVVRELHSAGFPQAAVIGKVMPLDEECRLRVGESRGNAKP